MFFEEVKKIAEIASGKVSFMKNNKLGFALSSLLAGIFIGIGVLLIVSIGGHIPPAPAKIIMGASFAVALSLVIAAGAELFTGNNMIMALGMFKKDVSLKEGLSLWLFCYIFNWLGSILIALMFVYSGLFVGGVADITVNIAAMKMNIPLDQLIIRSILCNFLVCLAVWCSFRLKSESGKFIMVFWCILAFVITGFEHSIANMTMLTAGLFGPANPAVTLGGYFYNILVVSLGNMIGGILFVAVPYYIMSRNNNKDKL